MKNITKYISVLLLSLVVVHCHAQKMMSLYITNNTDFPLYGNVYKTNIAGKVIENAKYFCKIDPQECLIFDKQQPNSLKKRATQYQRIILSTSVNALTEKIRLNKKDKSVASQLLHQDVFSKKTPSKKHSGLNIECYKIEGDGDGLTITDASDTSCPADSCSSVPFNRLTLIPTIDKG